MFVLKLIKNLADKTTKTTNPVRWFLTVKLENIKGVKVSVKVGEITVLVISLFFLINRFPGPHSRTVQFLGYLNYSVLRRITGVFCYLSHIG
jgi:hypothetical protein